MLKVLNGSWTHHHRHHLFLHATVSTQTVSSDSWLTVYLLLHKWDIAIGQTTLLPREIKIRKIKCFFLEQGLQKVGLKMSSGPLLYSKAGLLGFKRYSDIFDSVSRIAYIWLPEDTSEINPRPSQKRFLQTNYWKKYEDWYSRSCTLITCSDLWQAVVSWVLCLESDALSLKIPEHRNA